MKVRALKSFSALVGSRVASFPRGKVFDLPPGVDWLKVGLVEVVGITTEPEVQAEPEAPRPTRRRASKKAE